MATVGGFQQVRGKTIVFAFVIALLVASCGSQGSDDNGSKGLKKAGPEMVEKANDEGEVVFYSSLPTEQNEILAQAFNKKYPEIKVQIVRAGSLKILQRLEGELEAGALEADVVHTLYPPGFIQLKKNDHLASYVIKDVNHYPDDPDYIDTDNKWSTLRVVGNAIAYNPKVLGDVPPPKEWEDLLDPMYKGMLASASPTYGGTQFLQYFMWLEKYGGDFITKLAQQDLQMVESHGALSSLIITGERAIAVEMNDYQVWSDKYIKGAPVDYVYPTENVLVVPGNVAVLKKAPHPNAARVFIDWLTSKEGQKVIQTEVGAYSARDDAPPIEGRPAFRDLDAYQPDWDYLVENISKEEARITKLVNK